MELERDEIIEKYNITHEYRNNNYSMPHAHYHDHYEIYYLKKGSVRYFINDSVCDLSEGDIILISPRVIHKTATLKNSRVERYVLAFKNEFIMTVANDKILDCFRKPYYKNPPIGDIIKKTEKEHRRGDMYSEELVRGYIRELLVCLTRVAMMDNTSSRTQNDSIIQRAVRYIGENYSGEITLSSLAKHFALSESHFSRQFSTYTGFGVSEYITLVRIKNAEIMLDSTKDSITDIAAKCGFNSSSYFTAVFKKLKGMTPYEQRKKKRAEV